MTESQTERLARAERTAEMLTVAARLARASGCPVETNVMAWCEAHGLIAPDGAGGYVLTPQASTRVVP
jgi:hypothetical protein